MKNLKSLAIISLASLFAFGQVQAAEPKKTAKKPQTKQVAKKQTSKKSSNKTSTAKKVAAGTAAAAATTAAATKAKQDPLKEFNEAFGIAFKGYHIANDESGQPFLFLKYDLINKGTKAIQAVKFIGAFSYNNDIIYAQEIPLTFNTPLKEKEHNSIEMKIPLSHVPEAARNLFQTPNAAITAINGAQTLVFSDKTGIVVK